MVQKVIIDADPGIGDAVAIALALLDPEIDVVGITATAGQVSGEDATRNVQAIVKTLDPPKWPRLGSSNAETPYQNICLTRVSPEALNGPSGLGDCEFRFAELHHPHDSAKLMIELVRHEPNEITLLTLGPLTNVEVACERAPEFLELLKGLLSLGGSIQVGGDVTASAELNVYADPVAARSVLRSPATKTLVPLDISSRVVLTFEQFNRLTSGSTPIISFLKQLLPYSFRAHHEQLGLEGIRVHEVVALAAIARPRLFRSEPMMMDVETKGDLTRGMTVFDRRGVRHWQTNIDVLCEIDAQGVLDYLSHVMRTSSA